MKRPKRYLLTYLWTWPWDLFLVWPMVLLARLFWGTRLQWNTGLWAIVRTDSWFSRKLFRGYTGITFGHGGIIIEGNEGGDGIDSPVEYHEDQHVEQYEFIMLAGLVVSSVFALAVYLDGGTVHWILHAAVWLLSWLVTYLCSVAQAWLRGEKPYTGSSLEEGAFARTDMWSRKNFS